MVSNPYFSIITPAYNRASFLPATIKSVQDQTFTNWEYIIIDDASKDNSEEIIRSYNDERIVYLKNEVNRERGYSRNRGLATAKGKYICFLDSDDEYCPNHLQYLFDEIQKRSEPIALLFSKSYQRFDNGPLEKRHFEDINKYDKYTYVLNHTFNHNCVAAHRNIFETEKFDETIPGLEDLDLWLHISMKYPLIQLSEYTNILNYHNESYTMGGFKRFQSELGKFKQIFNKPEFKDVLPKEAKNYLLSKCYYMLAICYAETKEYSKMYACIWNAYTIYPKGYNVNANKTMAVLFLYNIPILGGLIKKVVQLTK